VTWQKPKQERRRWVLRNEGAAESVLAHARKAPQVDSRNGRNLRAERGACSWALDGNRESGLTAAWWAFKVIQSHAP